MLLWRGRGLVVWAGRLGSGLGWGHEQAVGLGLVRGAHRRRVLLVRGLALLGSPIKGAGRGVGQEGQGGSLGSCDRGRQVKMRSFLGRCGTWLNRRGILQGLEKAVQPQVSTQPCTPSEGPQPPTRLLQVRVGYPWGQGWLVLRLAHCCVFTWK
jgi:hypothetical protein